jgi:hypothetical protein
MFEFKHLIEFQNKETFSLYGENFFGDKSIFWESHQSSLNELYKKIIYSDFPIKITDLETKHSILVLELKDFRIWLNENQPFSDSLKKFNVRNELIYSELLENCKLENIYEFEYYLEVCRVKYYYLTIEINKKHKNFTLNDISEYDLTELEKLKKIELIKTYDKSEMIDEFRRKRYKINGS